MKNSIDEIKCRIEAAKIRAGRIDDEILLVAVSKTQPLEKLIEAQKYGLGVFGENKVQELIDKYPLISNISWHFIGHLQKNKVKYIIDKVDLIHSLDSIGLVQEINRRAEIIERVIPVLVQINIGKEESKSGIFEEDIKAFMDKISEYGNISVNGLMTVPPISEDRNITRDYFRRMKDIFEKLKKLNYKNSNIKYLSMGMTDDFEIAIEEGANIIRIGTGIFGKRVYKEV